MIQLNYLKEVIMTYLAKNVLELTLSGLDAVSILSKGFGESENEILFIQEQLKVKGLLDG